MKDSFSALLPLDLLKLFVPNTQIIKASVMQQYTSLVIMHHTVAPENKY
jgi:hypothetical protein